MKTSITKNLFIILVCITISFVSAACTKQAVVITPDPDTFKGTTGEFAFLGGSVEDGGPIMERLCFFDIDKILDFSHLPIDKALKAKKLICGQKASPEAFKRFFDTLGAREKASLIRAFEFFGYNINAYGC